MRQRQPKLIMRYYCTYFFVIENVRFFVHFNLLVSQFGSDMEVGNVIYICDV